MTKQKTCKAPGCSNKFTPSRPFQTWCSFDCAIVLANIAKKKKEASKARLERKERREAKEKAKDRKDWLKDTERVCNAYIRLRDADKPCISCGRFTEFKDAGHYRNKSTTPELRFHEDNIHGQCRKCNSFEHGNLLEYRLGLIQRIGEDKVLWLESKHPAAKFSIETLKEIKAKYSKLARELRKERE